MLRLSGFGFPEAKLRQLLGPKSSQGVGLCDASLRNLNQGKVGALIILIGFWVPL